MTKTNSKTQTKCLKTQHMLYFWNPDDLLIPNMMIDTSPWSSCSRQSPWLPCSGHTISSTGPSVSPFRDFFVFNLLYQITFWLFIQTFNIFLIFLPLFLYSNYLPDYQAHNFSWNSDREFCQWGLVANFQITFSFITLQIFMSKHHLTSKSRAMLSTPEKWNLKSWQNYNRNMIQIYKLHETGRF